MAFGMEKLEWCGRMYERDKRTDGQTDRQTPHDGIGRACIASRGKHYVLLMFVKSKQTLIKLATQQRDVVTLHDKVASTSDLSASISPPVTRVMGNFSTKYELYYDFFP